MKVYRIFFLFTILFISIIAEEYETTLDGENVVINNNGGVRVVVFNEFDFEISIFYDSFNGEKLDFMINVLPLSTSDLNTFNGHTFHATKVGDTESIASITIHEGVNEYFFSPSPLPMKHESSYEVGVEVKDRLHPAVKIIGSSTTAMSARFRSMSSRTLDLWFDDGGGGTPQGTLRPEQDSTTNAYEGHVFFYTEHGKKSPEIGRFRVHKNQVLYLIRDDGFPPTKEFEDYTDAEMAFMSKYKNETGVDWRGFYGKNGPRGPPILHMWPAERIGQVHRVNSSHGKWSCSGPASRCQDADPVQLDIEVISRKPRAFVIENFLSDFEVESIINIATPRIQQSTVGNSDGGGVRKSSTRTSSNTWIARKTSAVTETLYLRAADVLQVDEALLNSNANAEEMQVVHYDPGQKYDAHHDWGVNGYAESRFITLLLYLSDQKHGNAGGETAFPKAAGGRGVKVHPGKGSAVLFYNLLPDGNSDDLALHEATPVREGEKWLSNFWVWDPKRK